MKILFSAIILSGLCILLISCGSGNLIKLQNGKKIDQRLIGTWYGSEKDEQQEGMEKKWEMIRNADGTFVLNFQAITLDETNKFNEKGNWWVINDKFYEYHEYSDQTDIYTYKVLNPKQVKFKSIEINVAMENENYEFIDTKK